MKQFKIKLAFFLFVIVSSTFAQMTETDTKYADKKILVQNLYYPKPGKVNEVFALRTAASERLKGLGLTSGRVLLTREFSRVVWQAEYKNLAALLKELSILEKMDNGKFDKDFREKMKPLIEKFERSSGYVITE